MKAGSSGEEPLGWEDSPGETGAAPEGLKEELGLADALAEGLALEGLGITLLGLADLIGAAGAVLEGCSGAGTMEEAIRGEAKLEGCPGVALGFSAEELGFSEGVELDCSGVVAGLEEDGAGAEEDGVTTGAGGTEELLSAGVELGAGIGVGLLDDWGTGSVEHREVEVLVTMLVSVTGTVEVSVPDETTEEETEVQH